MADLTAQIFADYPSFAYLLNEPGLIDPQTGQNLLIEAVDPEKGFDVATFQARLMQTDWWKNTSAASRQWETLAATDPATAWAQRTERTNQVQTLAAQLGLSLPASGLHEIVERSLFYGVDASSATMRNWLATLAGTTPGAAATNASSLKATAEGTYMIPMSDHDAQWWAASIAGGSVTEDMFKANMQSLAKGRFPGYANLIDQGLTPGQIFAPYRQTIAQQLEISPDSVDLLNDPRWSAVTGTRRQNGTIDPMTLSETISLARSQPEWKRTNAANDQASQLGSQLLQTLGAVK